MPTTQSLYEKLATEFANQLEEFNYAIFRDKIKIQDDLDGTGEYIAAWDYTSSIPASLTSYDRTSQ
jgi:predicted transcriptional regulator